MALHSAVTAITHNIPGFLRQPAEALIGPKCYTSLVYNFDLTDVDCLKYALSKGLGLGIVLGGGIVKIPQIMKIVSTKSARGLSLSAYILETASYAISLAYAARNHFPFSTYGENFFLTLQNVAITLLILHFSTSPALSGTRKLSSGADSSSTGKVVAGLVISAISGFVLASESLCPPRALAFLQAVTLPLSLSSKVPQILSNNRNGSTGNLSAFAVFNALLGCLARLFTTKQEVNDPLIFWGFAGAAVLNAVIAAQMVLYWNKGDAIGRKLRATEDGPSQPGSPARKQDHAQPARWARKLD